MATINIKIFTGESAANIRSNLANAPKHHAELMKALSNTMVGSSSMQVQLQNDDAAKATATITWSGVATANDTILINGVTFTAKASNAGANEFNIGASANASALAFAASLNASVTALIAGYVTANVTATGVVTLTAVKAGTIGNLITAAKGVDGGTVVTVSTARLTGGVDESASFFSPKSITGL